MALRNSVKQAWRTLRTEGKLSCPLQPPKTWYGRAFAGAVVTSGIITGLAGSYWIGDAAHKGCNRAYNYWTFDSQFAESRRHTQKLKEEAENKRLRTCNDTEFLDWHRDVHGTRGLALTLVTAASGLLSRVFFWGARNSPNFCASGGYWALAALGGGMAAYAGLNALSDVHAWYAKKRYLDDARLARERNEAFVVSRALRKFDSWMNRL